MLWKKQVDELDQMMLDRLRWLSKHPEEVECAFSRTLWGRGIKDLRFGLDKAVYLEYETKTVSGVVIDKKIFRFKDQKMAKKAAKLFTQITNESQEAESTAARNKVIDRIIEGGSQCQM